MKIAVVYNRQSKSVINLFGRPNKEKIGLKTIKRLTDALKKGGHQVIALEGDKDLIDNLEEFMPRVVKGERMGMVFNVSYGLQGQARYTQVPSILEMVGVPYVASGPLAHSLALDKVVTKMILRQNGLPTPDFVMLNSPDQPLPELRYPMIVKPRSEAVSFGLKIVHDEAELRAASKVIFDEFDQPVLAEQFIEGREINVGLLGNNPPEALPPVELLFGEGGPGIYTYEDKTGRSGRKVSHACPAPISEELTKRAKEIAVGAFQALGISDCARVDMRLNADGELFILEVNSLPSLGEHGSYLVGAAAVGLDFEKFVNRLVEVASARYFGAPDPASVAPAEKDPAAHAAQFITQRRDQMERRLREWVQISSRSQDPIGLQTAVHQAREVYAELGMKPVDGLSDPPHAYVWQTAKGLDDGTLFIAHLDVPLGSATAHQPFRRDPEKLFGEGVGTSRAPLTALEFALRSLRSIRRLRRIPAGVLLYTDEGLDARHSAEAIRAAASRAKRVVVLRPGSVGDGVITRRRGHRKFRLTFEGDAMRPGRPAKRKPPLEVAWGALAELDALTSHKDRISLNTVDLRTERHAPALPHRIVASLLMTYPDKAAADAAEARMREVLSGCSIRWELQEVADRPPMADRAANKRLAQTLADIGAKWDAPLEIETSLLPSVAGLVPAKVAAVCGVGPTALDLGTPFEAVTRIGLVQRSVVLAELLAADLES